MCKVLCNTLGEGKSMSNKIVREQKQYHVIYRRRLENLTPLIISNYTNVKNEEKAKQTTVTQLEETKKAFIIGNIVRQSKLFITTVDENVLSEKEYQKKKQSNANLDQIGTKEDKIFLEDLTGRILLTFPENFSSVDLMITGLTLGIVGYSDSSGEFVIEDVIYPLNISNEIVERNLKDYKKPNFGEQTILFLSSLNLDHRDDKYKETIYNLKMLMFNTSKQFEKLNVIVSGPIIKDSYMKDLAETSYIAQDQEIGDLAEQIKIIFNDLDSLFLSVIQNTNTDIYIQPGIDDPTDNTYPVPALCSFFFEKSVKFSRESTKKGKIYALRNPDFVNIEGNNIVMNCGSNVEDYYRNCCSKNTHAIILSIIKSALNIPTCPMYSDSKVCFDCEDFITMKKPADLYVFGKSNKFDYLETEEKNDNKNIKMIRIEEFYKTNKVGLLGLQSGNFYVFECCTT